MKLLIDIAPGTTVTKEIREIRKAFKNAEKVRSGRLKGRPAEGLLKELK
jgi:hypothetical protein